MTEPAAASDGELLAQFAEARSQSAFELLVQRHAPLVLRVCRGILREHSDADDAAQAAFLTLAQKAPALRGHTSIAGWLHRVAWHIAMRAREARRLRQARERDLLGASRDDQSRADADAGEIAALVHEHLQALPEKYRVPLVLHYLEGWSEAEIAQMLGRKLGTVSGRLGRGRQMLRRRLAPHLAPAVSAGAVTALLTEAAKADATVDSAFLTLLAKPDPSAHAAALAESAARMLSARRARGVVIASLIGVVLIGIIVGIGMTIADRGSTPPNATPVLATTGQLVGRVIGPSGGPVIGAAVRVYASRQQASDEAPPLSVERTDANGEFAFENVAPGDNLFLLCVIQRPTFMHAQATTGVRAGEKTDVGEIMLREGRY